ncbi:MAG: hypothetical protein KA113_02740 [Syntrophaceae bacterium]|jgi:hypothetical protein|nr:hypothetical protein [Syntrophaceae bacterium]
MDQKQIIRQMLEFNKAAFDNHFKAMLFFQNQNEQYLLRFLDKATWLPEEGKKAMNEWLSAYKKGRESFKDYADEGYKKATDYFTNLQSQEERQNKGKA